MTRAQRILFFLAILVATLGLIADAMGFFELVDAALLKERFGPYWWLVLGVGLLTVGVALFKVLQFGPAANAAPEISPAALEANLAVLRRKVKRFWIEGVLEQSLYRKMLLELDMQHTRKAVEHPWEKEFQIPGGVQAPIPRGKNMEAVFAEAGRSLLILGEPGSGKTITLLDLARELTGLSEEDSSLPIPVVFNLASWAERRLPLREWLEEEFRAKYQVGRLFSEPWIREGRIVFLLDGLDEVRGTDREVCAKAINAFLKEQPVVPGIAVCSRRAEYEALRTRLGLGGAVTIAPLRPEQISSYLDGAGEKLQGLKEALKADSSLMELTEKPLMLNVMCLTYEGVVLKHVRGDFKQHAASRRESLYDAYIRRIFVRKGKQPSRYTPKQILTWLSYLARQMRAHSALFSSQRLARLDWVNGYIDLPTYRTRVLTGMFITYAADASPGLRKRLASKLRDLQDSPPQ